MNLADLDTKTVLVGMLTENTGRHMLDSGGAYGRNWERNQGRDFDAEPAASLDVTWNREGDGFRPDITLSVYHWLTEKVSYDSGLDAIYQAFAAPRREETGEFAIMEDFVEFLGASGIYGDGDPCTINTYNGDCLLSQTLQFIFFTHNDSSYILLQVHGGCDVRGGYTDARVFAAEEDVLYFTNATIFADGEGAFDKLPYWTTDDGYNFYHEGAFGLGAGEKLDHYKVSYNPEHKGDGVHVYVDEENNAAYCPISGFPLAVSAH